MNAILKPACSPTLYIIYINATAVEPIVLKDDQFGISQISNKKDMIEGLFDK